MAIMYPRNISEYILTDSEQQVYYALKTQLPDTYEVFYSVSWTTFEKGHVAKSEADFIILDPDNGFLCLEVKGGSIRVEDNEWYVSDSFYGERKLSVSPFKQAEKNMYHFTKVYQNRYHYTYKGVYAAGVVFPFCSIKPEMNLDKRDRDCTIDSNEMNSLKVKIERMFKVWNGDKYGMRIYPKSQHKLFTELIKENLAIEAASGALIKFKERQLSVINRVQDNYIYLLKGVKHFLIRGGAGTGKTWIAMKMAQQSAHTSLGNVLFVCYSKTLADMVRSKIGEFVDVLDVDSLLRKYIKGYSSIGKFNFKDKVEIVNGLGAYEAIFIDEAQDLTEEWARIISHLLKEDDKSRLGVFYDEVQILRDESFGCGFGSLLPIFYLHENIRNTLNIYNWTANRTNLGKDMIANTVEGPVPTTEMISEPGQLTLNLEILLKRYLGEEHLPNTSLVIIVENVHEFISQYPEGIAQWHFVNSVPTEPYSIRVASIEDFKGLESDMVFYIHSDRTTSNMNYIAYTRAKYYLKEFVMVF